jgi:hypothetical protein
MDFVYIPEVFTYGYSRNPQYRDYEQPWNQDYFKRNSNSKYIYYICLFCNLINDDIHRNALNDRDMKSEN